MLFGHLGLHGRLVKRIIVTTNSKVVDPEPRFQLHWAKGKVVRSNIVPQSWLNKPECNEVVAARAAEVA